ncbi:hypothetical protein ABOB61_14040, partial [Escherichia coli]
GSGVKIAEGMKKTAPDGAVSGMPAIRETGPGKNLQAITVSTKPVENIAFVGRIRRSRRIRQEAIRKGRRSSPPFLFLQSAIIIPQIYTFWVNT